MIPILHIEPNGDWYLERPHATGSDFGPGRYGEHQRRDCDADRAIEFYKWAAKIDDRRPTKAN